MRCPLEGRRKGYLFSTKSARMGNLSIKNRCAKGKELILGADFPPSLPPAESDIFKLLLTILKLINSSRQNKGNHNREGGLDTRS